VGPWGVTGIRVTEGVRNKKKDFHRMVQERAEGFRWSFILTVRRKRQSGKALIGIFYPPCFHEKRNRAKGGSNRGKGKKGVFEMGGQMVKGNITKKGFLPEEPITAALHQKRGAMGKNSRYWGKKDQEAPHLWRRARLSRKGVRGLSVGEGESQQNHTKRALGEGECCFHGFVNDPLTDYVREGEDRSGSEGFRAE